MGKRYVYWRMPDGKPYKGNDGKYAPGAVLTEIGQSANINDKGQVCWHDLTVHRLQMAVRSVVVVCDSDSNEINEDDTTAIISPVISSVILRQGAQKPITPIAFLNEANKRAAQHFSKPIIDYVLVSSLSVAELPSSRIRVQSCDVFPLKARGNRFDYPEALKRQAPSTPFAEHIASSKYQLIKVKTSGRTPLEGASKAINSLAFLRGLWTLFATYGAWSMNFGMRKDKPLGVIYPGAVHTLHNIDGSLVDNVWWYEPDYTGDQALFNSKVEWKDIEKNRLSAMRRLKSLPYRTEMEDLIADYALALDQVHLDVTFLHMWSLLERITDTVGGNYDETIRRATWIYHDRHIARGLLEAVRCRRNRLVHAARSADERDQIAYLVKSFVDPHLLRLIRNDFSVQNFKEYGEVLSLPRDVATLEKRRRHVNRALRMAETEDTET